MLAVSAVDGVCGFMAGGMLSGTGSVALGGSAAAHLGGLNPVNAPQRRMPASSPCGVKVAPSRSARRGCGALRMDANADLREAAEFGFVHKSGWPRLAPSARCLARRRRMHPLAWEKGTMIDQLGKKHPCISTAGRESNDRGAPDVHDDACRIAVDQYVKAGADVNSIDVNDSGKAAIHKAALQGHTAAVVRLVELGADINMGSDSESTAMHFAGAYGHLQTVDQLLKLGADPTKQNEFGEDAYTIANMKVREMPHSHHPPPFTHHPPCSPPCAAQSS